MPEAPSPGFLAGAFDSIQSLSEVPPPPLAGLLGGFAEGSVTPPAVLPQPSSSKAFPTAAKSQRALPQKEPPQDLGLSAWGQAFAPAREGNGRTEVEGARQVQGFGGARDFLSAAAFSVLNGARDGSAPTLPTAALAFGSERPKPAPSERGSLSPVPVPSTRPREPDRAEEESAPKRRRLLGTPVLRPRSGPDEGDASPIRVGPPGQRSEGRARSAESERTASEADDGRKPFYTALGLRSDATPDQIHRAYRRLALRWHPDKNSDRRQEAERRFKELLFAYETLSDPARRRAYDRPVDPHELTALLGRLMAGRVSAREAPTCLHWVACAIATLADRLDADRELEASQRLQDPNRSGGDEKKVMDPNPVRDDPAEPAVTLIVLGMLLRAYTGEILGPFPIGLEENVERLQHHPSELVYALAYTVMLDHFELEGHAGEEIRPVQASSTPSVGGAPERLVIPPLADIEGLPPPPPEEDDASA